MDDARTGTGSGVGSTRVAGNAVTGAVDPGARWLRRFRWISTLTLLAFLLAAWGRLLVVDGPLPDDADLIHVPVEGDPPEENAWTLLLEHGTAVEGIDVLQWFRVQPPTPLIDPKELRFELSRAAEWPGSPAAAAAHEFLRTHGPDFAFLEEMLARPHRIIPLAPGESQAPPEIIAVRSLFRWLEFRSSVALLDGRIDDAIADDLHRIALGDMLRRIENGSLLQRAAGASFQAAAVSSLLEHLVTSPLDDERLARIAAALAEPAGKEDALESALRLEYTWFRGAILGTPRSIAFKPHRTLAILAERRRAQIRELALPHSERVLALLPTNPGAWDRLLAALGGNGNGQLLVGLDPDLGSMVESHDASLFVRRAASIAVALMRHRLRTGELPASLDALVPDFLPALPVDPFTHEPIRYDPVRGILWSPGADGIDGGGAAGGLVEADPAEPTLRIPGL